MTPPPSARAGVALLVVVGGLLSRPATGFSAGAARPSRPLLARVAAARAAAVRAVEPAAATADAPAADAADAPAAAPSQQLPYDWRAQWYAVCFEENLPQGAEPLAYSVFGHGLALWRDGGGALRAVADRCPHRAAKLSEGRVRDGALECLYHGWQFEGAAGRCLAIPQLEPGAAIPARACVAAHAVAVREGIVFVWMEPNRPLAELPAAPASADDLDADPTFTRYSFQIDLPYDASFLVENLLDPAHIPVSHDRTPGGGKREDAQPLAMEVDAGSVGPAGFEGRFRSTRAPAAAKKAAAPPAWIDVRFAAPGIIYQRRQLAATGGLRFGAALHCMPLAAGRSRLLFRTYFKGLPRAAGLLLALKPLWARHLNSCKILEQDAGLIATQEDNLAAWRTAAAADDDAAEPRTLAAAYLPLRSSDAFVVEYRKWLDKVGHGMPWAVGWDAPAAAALARAAPLASRGTPPPGLLASHRATAEDRYSRHVRHTPSSRRALARIRRLKTTLLAFGGAAALVAAALSPGARATRAALAAAALVGGSVAALHVERAFYAPFERREQLRLRERPN
jgi:phenylpropionate dioxygenase-like ring-hydroxylating dioxygenase large terminal subunit